MLNVPTPFPHQGSLAHLIPTAERVRIIRRNADGTVLVARVMPEGGSREARLAFHNRGATRDLTVPLAHLRETSAEAAAAGVLPALTGHRQEQLELLAQAGAATRETAVAVSFDRSYRPGTLSRMAEEGLVAHGQLPLNGDSRRRVSHYWLTDRGQLAVSLLGQ